MGILHFSEPYCSKIYLTEIAKDEAVCQAAVEDSSEDRSVLVVSHFPATLRNLKAVFAQKAIKYRETPENAPWEPRTFHDPQTPITLLHWPNSAPPAAKDYWASFPAWQCLHLTVLVADCHPLPEHEQAVVDFCSSIPVKKMLFVYLSMEDALMRTCGVDRMMPALKKLGMQADECIESQLVDRQIRAAQKRVKEKSRTDKPAASSEEWFKYNAPDLLPPPGSPAA